MKIVKFIIRYIRFVKYKQRKGYRICASDIYLSSRPTPLNRR